MFSAQMHLPATTSDGRARQLAIQSLVDRPVNVQPTSLVSYTSRGRLLIVGAEHAAAGVIEKLTSAELVCICLVNSASTKKVQLQDVTNQPDVYRADGYEVSGHLGAFSVAVQKDGRNFDLGQVISPNSIHFDMILEFSSRPNIPAEIPPPGYYWIHSEQPDSTRLEQAIEEIPSMTGNFEKPKYYNYDPDICAHSRSGITACTRCIDVCPTDAIISIGEQIQVDSYLCQGGGSCSTACPTGAITYAYPSAGNLLEILRQLILNYRQGGGTVPYILFYDQEHGRPIVEESIPFLPENILPVEVEEVGSIGLDVLLGTLSYGASRLSIISENAAESAVSELNAQLAILDGMIQGLGFDASPVELITSNSALELSKEANRLAPVLDIDSAKFLPSGIKRTDIRIALEHLHSEAPLKPESVSLPAHAPFGEIHVNIDTCTLCMGCVSVCPASALEAGGDVPKLSFIENNCVQCGMCESACPENSISRTQRYVFAADARLRSRTMNEDSPFHCTKCGKPFATHVMMNHMKSKLKNHWMFTKPDALARLEMCEDCRVKDMFVAERERFERQ